MFSRGFKIICFSEEDFQEGKWNQGENAKYPGRKGMKKEIGRGI